MPHHKQILCAQHPCEGYYTTPVSQLGAGREWERHGGADINATTHQNVKCGRIRFSVLPFLRFFSPLTWRSGYIQQSNFNMKELLLLYTSLSSFLVGQVFMVVFKRPVFSSSIITKREGTLCYSW